MRREHIRLMLRAALCAVLLFVGGCADDMSSRGDVGHFHTVIVDAGHGGSDTGAKAKSGQSEKYIALDTAKRLAKELRKRGFRVIETRQDDRFIPLGNRTEISNRTGGAIFVSVHYNWARRSSPRGIEIYYYNPRSRPLAVNILQRTVRVCCATTGGQPSFASWVSSPIHRIIATYKTRPTVRNSPKKSPTASWHPGLSKCLSGKYSRTIRDA
jgi:N-acetylmuramoyl-L-alanine amidase